MASLTINLNRSVTVDKGIFSETFTNLLLRSSINFSMKTAAPIDMNNQSGIWSLQSVGQGMEMGTQLNPA